MAFMFVFILCLCLVVCFSKFPAMNNSLLQNEKIFESNKIKSNLYNIILIF